ncbi:MULTISPECIES: hypothetical protein [Pseudomonadota]|uniref:hypothetical protein n=1 Tax=Pseudomonadota TaxID=1224 RepID=UPI000AE70E3A|nr:MULTISPECIES: hypothetical protein [Pseudomonadota]MCH1984683.1 hypothetical protein [Achromobacter xylosoxidans]MCH1993173.1 hypothetical protein [Achromobacter xylosoxidans]MCH4586402.1 hypothetical protein [Achromobacter xylosoxidans]
MKSVEHSEYLPDTEVGRSLFRERLIAKIQQHRDFKALPHEIQSNFFEKLAELTLFGTNNCSLETHSPRTRKLEKLADSYRRVANSIALLSEIDELLLDDAFQHSMPLQQQKKLMRQLTAQVDELIGAMRQTPSGTSERFLLRLQGASLLNQLGKLGVACKINNDFQKIDQDDVSHREESEGVQHFLPDLSQSMTLAMLCTMLTILNNGQVVEWSHCRRLLKEGKKALAFERRLAESLPRSDELLVLKNQILQHGQ